MYIELVVTSLPKKDIFSPLTSYFKDSEPETKYSKNVTCNCCVFNSLDWSSKNTYLRKEATMKAVGLALQPHVIVIAEDKDRHKQHSQPCCCTE